MRRRVLWVVIAISAPVYAALLVRDLPSWEAPDLATLTWLFLMVPSMVGAGIFLIVKRPENPIGDLVAWGGLTMFLLPSILEIPTLAAFSESGTQDWMWIPMTLAMTSGLVGFVLLMAVVVLLPDGRVRYPREKRLLRAVSFSIFFPAVHLLTNEFVWTHSQSFIGIDDAPSPVFIPALEALGPATIMISNLVYAGFVLAVVFQVMRYRRAPERERKQVRWVLFGGGTAMVIGLLPYMLETLGLIGPVEHGSLGSLIIVPVFFIFMGSIVVAVLEPRWVDVDLVIRKSLVYGALSFLILVTYVAAASALGLAAGSRLDVEIAVVLTVVVALLFQPVRRRLQVVADRWVFGARPSRYEAVTELGETIERASDPTELIPRLVETIRKAIRVEWVSATLDDGTHAESGGVPGQPILIVPIGSGNEEIGVIKCGPKSAGPLEEDEKHLVQTLAGQVGLAVMNARLAGRIVDAAEAERRRIERNIHDGAQQELVALVARLGIAKTKAATEGLSPKSIEELQREAQRILTDLRDLAQGIHPSVLSDGGILEAVQESCTYLPVEVTLRAPESLRSRRFDDRVEGAAYFFVTESITNILKHAEALHAEVSMRTDKGSLLLSVSDDGRGFDAEHTRLNGLAGLEDRMRALGGSVAISSRPGEGTTVTASIPVE